MTELDTAHAAMEAAPENDTLRLQFYERLADTEIFMLLGEEAAEDQISPEIFEIDGQKFTLVFDREERLSQFVERVAPYAGLPGRALAQMLAGTGIGLAFNLEVAPSSMLIPAAAVDWLAETLENGPQETEARISELITPNVPQSVVSGLDRKLAMAAGLARLAYLVGAVYEDATPGHVLAFLDAREGAESTLAAAANEALTFSGIEAGMIDVLFVQASDPLAAHLAKVGLRFDLPTEVQPTAPSAPGLDPAKPPRLR